MSCGAGRDRLCAGDPHVGTEKPRPGSGGGPVSSQPSPLPASVQAAGKGKGERRVGAAGLPRQVCAHPRARGEPGLACGPGDPRPHRSQAGGRGSRSPEPGGERGWRIGIHVPSPLIDGTPGSAAPAPAVSLHLVKHPVTMTDGASPGGCCSVCFSRIFAVLAAQSRAKDKRSCAETFTWASEVTLRELQREKQQLCRETQRWGKQLLTKPSWHGFPSA